MSRVLAAYLLHGAHEATVYTAGSGATGEVVAGLSDVDLVLVVGGERGEVDLVGALVSGRWRRLRRRLPRLSRGLGLAIYGERDLEDEAGGTCLTYGLGGDGVLPPEAGYLREGRPADELYRRLHPGIYGPGRTWRRVRGSARTRSDPVESVPYRRLASWLELQWWWRFAFEMCTSPRPDFAAYLAFKLVAEPARIWLWLAHGERAGSRRDAIERARRLLPQEDEVLRHALGIYEALPRAEAPRAETLGWLLRTGDRIAALLEDGVREDGSMNVKLEAGPGLALSGEALHAERSLTSALGRPRLLPLADWRARAMPPLADEALALLDADLTDPATVGTAARASVPGLQTAVRAGRLLVLPGDAFSDRVLLRSVQCALSDPVSFALIDGRTSAVFPNVPGWSALDCARRAVAEHAAWLRGWRVGAPPPERALDLLLTAARAAIFLDGARAGRPVLPLTAAATVSMLADADPKGWTAAESALEAFRRSRANGDPPKPEAIMGLRTVVGRLPGLAGPEQRA